MANKTIKSQINRNKAIYSQTRLNNPTQPLHGDNGEVHKMKVNLEGSKPKERHYIEPDAYFGRIVEVSPIYQTKGFEGQDVEKTTISVEITLDGKEKRTVILPHFVSATVIHASKQSGYSDSKLYTVIENAGVMETFKKFWAESKDLEDCNPLFVNWLRTVLIGKDVRVMVKTITPEVGEKYSVVKEIIKFLPMEV